MSRFYNKIDRKRNWISLATAISLLVLVLIALFTLPKEGPYYTIFTFIAFANVFFTLFLVVRVGLLYARRVSGLMYETQETLLKGSLEEEILMMDDFVTKNPKHLQLYAFTLFAFTRILYGPKIASLYLDSTRRKMESKRTSQLIKANFIIEQCYYYLMENDIETFLVLVDEMKSYGVDVYKKIMKQAIMINPKKIEVPEEHKELAFIATLYTKGPDEEKIERLVNHKIPYYRMQYTLFVLNYYRSVDDKEKIAEYQNRFDAFQGDIYPLKGD